MPKTIFRARWQLLLSLPAWLACGGLDAHAAAEDRPRLVVLTDIGGDPDDQQSLIRLLLYSNEFEIEALIATASGIPGELKEAVVKPELIREIVEAYGQVRSNLLEHAGGYPGAEDLLEGILSGNPRRGREAIGPGRDTEGSKGIIAAASREDPRPLNIVIWGGQTDLAQALWRVRQDRGPEGLVAFQSHLRIYDIGDQDQIAHWMNAEYPGPFYILPNPRPGEDRRETAYRGMYLGGDESLVSRDWMEQNIRSDHGPLGALYPPHTWTAPNPHSAMKEGDTPSWFYFLPNGLSDPARPDWGGWGGRFSREGLGIWRDVPDSIEAETHVRCSVWRWRPAFQADFQARLDWCVTPREQANHPPQAVVNGDASRSVLFVSARGGEPVALDAGASSDPDGHSLSYRWWVYREAGTMPELPAIENPESAAAQAVLRPGEAGETAHIILEVRDDGDPALTSFRRVILERVE